MNMSKIVRLQVLSELATDKHDRIIFLPSRTLFFSTAVVLTTFSKWIVSNAFQHNQIRWCHIAHKQVDA